MPVRVDGAFLNLANSNVRATQVTFGCADPPSQLTLSTAGPVILKTAAPMTAITVTGISGTKDAAVPMTFRFSAVLCGFVR